MGLDAPRPVHSQLHGAGIVGDRTRPLRMLATARAFVSDPFETKLERVGVPSLVVRGDRDRVAPMDWADQVSARLGGVPLEVIPGAAHTVVYSVPQQLAALVSAFVEGVGGHLRGAVQRRRPCPHHATSPAVPAMQTWYARLAPTLLHRRAKDLELWAPSPRAAARVGRVRWGQPVQGLARPP